MTWFKEYELALSLDEAVAMLGEPKSAIIGGGSRLVAAKPEGIERYIDLMPLGLDLIKDDDDALTLQARVRLEDLAVRDDFDGLLREAILSLAHSVNLRNQMTVAGETAWLPHLNEWQVALLALDAVVLRHGLDPTPAAEYLASPAREGIITALSLPKRAGRRYGFDRVAPADGARPLMVFAGALQVGEGTVTELRLALGNLGALPLRLTAVEQRLTGRDAASLDSFTLEDADRAGVNVVEGHNAGVDAKWSWAETLIQRFLSAPGEERD